MAKVLIVDEDPSQVKRVTEILAGRGYATISENEAGKGLERAMQEKPDIILLDLMMSHESGMSLFQHLKDSPEVSGIPVIILTDLSRTTGVDFRNFIYKHPGPGRKKAIGTDGSTEFTVPAAYLEKPVDPDELIKAIQDVLID